MLCSVERQFYIHHAPPPAIYSSGEQDTRFTFAYRREWLVVDVVVQHKAIWRHHCHIYINVDNIVRRVERAKRVASDNLVKFIIACAWCANFARTSARSKNMGKSLWRYINCCFSLVRIISTIWCCDTVLIRSVRSLVFLRMKNAFYRYVSVGRWIVCCLCIVLLCIALFRSESQSHWWIPIGLNLKIQTHCIQCKP